MTHDELRNIFTTAENYGLSFDELFAQLDAKKSAGIDLYFVMTVADKHGYIPPRFINYVSELNKYLAKFQPAPAPKSVNSPDITDTILPANCSHRFVDYQGFTDFYRYCTICDIKENDLPPKLPIDRRQVRNGIKK